MAKMTMVQAINLALRQEMDKDDSVVVLGEDVGVDGGVFRVTDGLIDQFGKERVMDTPLAESGIIGVSIGMAVYGLKPVCEIQFSGFIYEGLKSNCGLIVNGIKAFVDKPHENISLLGMVDAELIAREEIGVAAPNTCMVGAFAAATGWISLESVVISLEDYFNGDLLKKNIRSAERGFDEVEVIQWPK